MRVTSKGQVTIPIQIREKLGILPNTEVEFQLQGSSARLVKVDQKKPSRRAAEMIARLKGSATVRMTTDEIMALTRK